MKPVASCQFGGAALFSIDKASHRVIEKWEDNSKLGRWVWTRYKGKGNQTLRIIIAYRPNPPGGPFTVYAQHNVFFHSTGTPRCPRKAFLRDLHYDIDTFLDAGDHIILLVDGNSNVKNCDLKTSLDGFSLTKVILDKHRLNGPSTFC